MNLIFNTEFISVYKNLTNKTKENHFIKRVIAELK